MAPLDSAHEADPQPRQPFLPRFGIAEMMLTVMILCVMGAAGGYLRGAIQNNNGRAVFVIFTLAAPIALVLVLSTYLGLKRWLRTR
jgi:hypothetical protein